jgi:hypothetical protein
MLNVEVTQQPHCLLWNQKKWKHIPKKMIIQMFTAALFTIASNYGSLQMSINKVNRSDVV